MADHSGSRYVFELDSTDKRQLENLDAFLTNHLPKHDKHYYFNQVTYIALVEIEGSTINRNFFCHRKKNLEAMTGIKNLKKLNALTAYTDLLKFMTITDVVTVLDDPVAESRLAEIR